MTTVSKGDMVQVHMLTAYPASLLNRDDAGLAKRIPFGSAARVRISSQCLKKHWRDSPLVVELGDQAYRSTRIYSQLVAQPLVDQHGASDDEANAIADYLMSVTVDTGTAKRREGEVGARSSQLLVLTHAETRFLLEQATTILQQLREAGVTVKSADDVKKHAPIDKKTVEKILKALPASIDTALFGRMVTSAWFDRIDSSVSVAHAFTTHAEESETDYFTAVDTLNADDAGAGLINETELTSGVFYSYAVIDMEQLRQNLGVHAEDAERLARNLVQTMATVSPGAKRGSTAPFAYAEFVMLERGAAQPRTLANAFLNPVHANGAGVMEASVRQLVNYRQRLAAMYGASEDRATVATIHSLPDDAALSTASFVDSLGTTFKA